MVKNIMTPQVEKEITSDAGPAVARTLPELMKRPLPEKRQRGKKVELDNQN